ncbi:DEAD/DEAH box helicase family protein, partial [Nitrosomonas sp.]|uniref:DEAD/DEAH box helicase family protein n=1 Tax=Nitrosomonas sp. TaxID=42353 RepID=UPI00273180FA
MDRVKNSNDNAYIWHTTGSGKTLTSFKASHLEVVIADTLYGSRDNRSYLERK